MSRRQHLHPRALDVLRRSRARGTRDCSLVVCLLFAAVRSAGQPPPRETEAGHLPRAAEPMAGDGLIASPEAGWPQWRGPCRDGISAEGGLLQKWPAAGPPLMWKAIGLGTGWSSPIVAGDRIYVTGDIGPDLVILALDLTGALRWRAVNGRAWTRSYPGARACLAFSEGRLYHLNAHGRLACLDAASGKELWAVDILERFDGANITWGLSECLLVDGRHVVVTPGGRKALMAALDKRDGRTVWTTEVAADDRASQASPILFRYGGRRLISGCSSAHGFGADADGGRLLWTVPLRNEFGVNVATPVYGRGSVYYVTPYAEEGRLYHLRAARDGISAEHAWTCPLDTVTGGGVLIGNTLATSGYRKAKRWFGIDWRTGQTTWETRELTTGAAVFADGRLYCVAEDGSVGLLNLGAEGAELVGLFKFQGVKANDAWAHPVVCGGRLYVRYHDTLWCYDVGDR